MLDMDEIVLIGVGNFAKMKRRKNGRVNKSTSDSPLNISEELSYVYRPDTRSATVID
jgi:hypothetical protein